MNAKTLTRTALLGALLLVAGAAVAPNAAAGPVPDGEMYIPATVCGPSIDWDGDGNYEDFSDVHVCLTPRDAVHID